MIPVGRHSDQLGPFFRLASVKSLVFLISLFSASDQVELEVFVTCGAWLPVATRLLHEGVKETAVSTVGVTANVAPHQPQL